MTLVPSLIALVLMANPVHASAEMRFEDRGGRIVLVESPLARAARTRPELHPALNADRHPYAAAIHAAAGRHGLPVELIESVIKVESNFNARAVSPRGARGLMQLMPETAARLGIRNSFDAQENVDGGVRHLRALLRRFAGNLRLALAAYNAGEEPVRRYRGVPPFGETRRYVDRVLALYGGDSAIAAGVPGMVTARSGPLSGAGIGAGPAPFWHRTPGGHVVLTNTPLPGRTAAADRPPRRRI